MQDKSIKQEEHSMPVDNVVLNFHNFSILEKKLIVNGNR